MARPVATCLPSQAENPNVGDRVVGAGALFILAMLGGLGVVSFFGLRTRSAAQASRALLDMADEVRLDFQSLGINRRTFQMP